MSAINEGGYVVLVTQSNGVAAPAGGATVTLFDSTAVRAASHGARFKMFIVDMYVSHASDATNGLIFSESTNKGSTWRVLTNTDTVSATTYTKTYKKMSAPDVKIEYKNGATLPTTWEYAVLGDPMERSNG